MTLMHLAILLLALVAPTHADHTLFILEARNKDAINTRMKSHVDKTGGERTASVALFPAAAQDDSAPGFYWFCIADSAMSTMERTELVNLKTLFATAQSFRFDLAADRDFPALKLAELGLRTAMPAISAKVEKPDQPIKAK